MKSKAGIYHEALLVFYLGIGWILRFQDHQVSNITLYMVADFVKLWQRSQRLEGSYQKELVRNGNKLKSTILNSFKNITFLSAPNTLLEGV